MSTELIADLELPADQIRAVRLVAGRIALAEGLDDDVAEDVKLAVGEACSQLAAAPGVGRLRVLFRREAEALTAEFPGFPAAATTPTRGPGSDVVEASDTDFGWLILAAVVPTWAMDGDTLRLAWPLQRVAAPHA